MSGEIPERLLLHQSPARQRRQHSLLTTLDPVISLLLPQVGSTDLLLRRVVTSASAQRHQRLLYQLIEPPHKRISNLIIIIMCKQPLTLAIIPMEEILISIVQQMLG